MASTNPLKKDDDRSDEKSLSLSAGGYLNLAADSMHNFTDGIAIGASFVGGKSVGIAMTLSVRSRLRSYISVRSYHSTTPL